jgi:hypothetical protein
MLCVGASMLLPNTSGNIPRKEYVCTPCAVLTSMPTSADTQHMARAKASTSRQPAAAASGLFSIRKPRIMPKPRVTATMMTYRTMSPSTAPASGAHRAIGRLRNRSNTPVEMSLLSISPVPTVPKITVMTRMPGSADCRYLCVLPAIAPPNT